ncbi:hypothetical protein ACFX1X_036296 [Malus domestica]
MQRGRFKPTAASYNLIIAHLCKEGKVDGAVKCLDQMVHRRCNPNEGTFSAIAVLCEEGLLPEAFSIIQSLCNKQKCSRYESYKNVFEMMIEKGRMPNEMTYTILVEGIAHEGELELAARVLKELHLRHVVSPNTVERLVMQYDFKDLPG